MISGVSSYSSYSSYSSTLASSARNSTANSTAASCSGGPAKAQEKLFSILDSDGDGSVAKEELDSALSAAKDSDSSLTIDIDELFSQLDANSDGSIDKAETAALAPPPPHGGPGGPGGANPEELFGQTMPGTLTELLQLLRSKDMLHQGMAQASWSGGLRSRIAVQVPAWTVSASAGKIALLDRRFADPFLVSVLANQGYSCFILPE